MSHLNAPQLFNAPQLSQQGNIVQRQSTEEEEENTLQMKPALQTPSVGVAAPPALETAIERSRNGGHPLVPSIRNPMEQAFGADFSRVRVHADAQADQLNQSIQSQAFTIGQNVFFRAGAYEPGSRGGQELIAHELTHVMQQTGGSRSPYPQGHQVNTIQRYTTKKFKDGTTRRVSDDNKAMLEITQAEGGQALYATKDLVVDANKKLETAGDKGSFIRLRFGKDSKKWRGHTLKQALPRFVDATGAESFNEEMAEANKPGGADSTGDTQNWFKLYADCGRSSRVVMGSLGLAPKALYRVGRKSKETSRAFQPGKWTDKVYLEAMKGFVKDPANLKYLKKEHLKKRFGAYFRSEENKYEPKTPTSGRQAKEFAGYLDDDGQKAFAEYAKINVAVNPEIGEGYTMATGYDLPGFTGGDKAWNFHWAGVVMKAGSDNITLENYAIMFDPTGDPVKDAENRQRAYDWTNTDWVFQMYGTVKEEQTFHEEHLASGTHGTKGTTFRVKI